MNNMYIRKVLTLSQEVYEVNQPAAIQYAEENGLSVAEIESAHKGVIVRFDHSDLIVFIPAYQIVKMYVTE